jgi:hypothetical protein
MPRLKYKFNPSTLNFEKISYGIRDYTISALRYLFAGLVIGAIGVVLYASFFKDPETARLSREVKFLKGQIADLNEQIDTLELFVGDLQDKVDNVYRSIFGAEPYPEHLRRGGVGGSDRYSSMRGYDNSVDIIETQKRINRLQRALVFVRIETNHWVIPAFRNSRISRVAFLLVEISVICAVPRLRAYAELTQPQLQHFRLDAKAVVVFTRRVERVSHLFRFAAPNAGHHFFHFGKGNRVGGVHLNHVLHNRHHQRSAFFSRCSRRK